MMAHPVLLQMKYARVVTLYSKVTGLTIEESLDRFYLSRTYQLMRKGISDMHCMSDMYLVEEIADEYSDQKRNRRASLTKA